MTPWKQCVLLTIGLGIGFLAGTQVRSRPTEVTEKSSGVSDSGRRGDTALTAAPGLCVAAVDSARLSEELRRALREELHAQRTAASACAPVVDPTDRADEADDSSEESTKLVAAARGIIEQARASGSWQESHANSFREVLAQLSPSAAEEVLLERVRAINDQSLKVSNPELLY